MLNDSKIRILLFIKLPLVFHWIIIKILTSLPSESLPNVSIGDKYEHFLAFFVLGFFLYLNFLYQNKFELLKKYPFILSLLIASLYGVFDELHQHFIPGRSAELMDWIADFIGAIVGISIASIFHKFFQENLKKYLNIKLEPLSE